MPTLAPRRTVTHRQRILAASAGLFRKQGFHGTSTREIADKAGVSLGNIYNHFKNKEDMFVALLADCETRYFSPDSPLAGVLMGTSFPDNLEELGTASKKNVEKFSEYLRLIYVDIVEFDAKHVSHIFSGMRDRYKKVLEAQGPSYKKKLASDIDPAAAMMMVTWSYFNYFVVERLFGVKGHYGMKDEDVIRFFARVFRKGILKDRKERKK